MSTPDATASAAAPVPRVDFYILEEPSAEARLRFACRLTEKAYRADHTVLVWHTEPRELQLFDELLWTFGDGSFVPHERLTGSTGSVEAPVLLSDGAPPPGRVDVLVNLAPALPACLEMALRIAEIVDGDGARRQAGRARFRAYRERGLMPHSHTIRGPQAPSSGLRPKA